jgi:HrpA-like RNA helicase
MDYFCFMNEMCRIVLAEPNDLSAYVMARRLANDLNEQVGQTIGLETNAENK